MIDEFSGRRDGRWWHGPFSNGHVEPDGSFVEAEYQAYAKTTDREKRLWILEARQPFGPDGAKRRGKQVPLRADHETVKFPVMTYFVAKKFREHESLAAELRATGQQLMVEGNDWHDNVWGDCRCANADGRHPECAVPGRNWLGMILMVVRETLPRVGV